MKPEYLPLCNKIAYWSYAQADERIVKQSKHRQGGMRIKGKFGFGRDFRVVVYKCERKTPKQHWHVGKTVADKPNKNPRFKHD